LPGTSPSCFSDLPAKETDSFPGPVSGSSHEQVSKGGRTAREVRRIALAATRPAQGFQGARKLSKGIKKCPGLCIPVSAPEEKKGESCRAFPLFSRRICCESKSCDRCYTRCFFPARVLGGSRGSQQFPDRGSLHRGGRRCGSSWECSPERRS
jgi:hypothetical protein